MQKKRKRMKMVCEVDKSGGSKKLNFFFFLHYYAALNFFL